MACLGADFGAYFEAVLPCLGWGGPLGRFCWDNVGLHSPDLVFRSADLALDPAKASPRYFTQVTPWLNTFSQ